MNLNKRTKISREIETKRKEGGMGRGGEKRALKKIFVKGGDKGRGRGKEGEEGEIYFYVFHVN